MRRHGRKWTAIVGVGGSTLTSEKLLSGSSSVGFVADVRIGRVPVYWRGGGQFDDRDCLYNFSCQQKRGVDCTRNGDLCSLGVRRKRSKQCCVKRFTPFEIEVPCRWSLDEEGKLRGSGPAVDKAT